MRRAARRALVLAVLGAAACTPAGVGSVPIAAQPTPEHPERLFASAVAHLASDARDRLLVDPRPLRPGGDLHRLDEADILHDAAEAIRLRERVLKARGIATTDAAADRRCTFSRGVGVPPERAPTVDSIADRLARCRAREPYTTLIFGLPVAAVAEPDAPATWHVEAVVVTPAGYQIWDLFLQPGAEGSWHVSRAEPRFRIWS